MAVPETETQYKAAFIARVKAARVARNFKQWQLAEALGMPQDKYKQYESRSLLPHHLIGRFCLITHIDPEWLITGRGDKGLRPLELVEAGKTTAPPAKPAKKAKGAA
jgi:transcriptional regulator with XRE-family HTH domain